MDSYQTVLGIFLIVQGIIFGAFSGFVASEKGREESVWFINGFLFSFVALIAICGLPSNSRKKIEETSDEDTQEKLGISFD